MDTTITFTRTSWQLDSKLSNYHRWHSVSWDGKKISKESKFICKEVVWPLNWVRAYLKVDEVFCPCYLRNTNLEMCRANGARIVFSLLCQRWAKMSSVWLTTSLNEGQLTFSVHLGLENWLLCWITMCIFDSVIHASSFAPSNRFVLCLRNFSRSRRSFATFAILKWCFEKLLKPLMLKSCQLRRRVILL